MREETSYCILCNYHIPFGLKIQDYNSKVHKYSDLACPQSCPICRALRAMWKHGSYVRKGGIYDHGEWIENLIILRYLCPVCLCTVSILPDFLTPGKHYSLGEISRVLHLYFVVCVNVHLIYQSLLSASESTLRRWIRDWDLNHKYLLLKGLLESGISTAEEIASRMNQSDDTRKVAFELCALSSMGQGGLKCSSVNCGEYVLETEHRVCKKQRCHEILRHVQERLWGLSPPKWLFRNI